MFYLIVLLNNKRWIPVTVPRANSSKLHNTFPENNGLQMIDQHEAN